VKELIGRGLINIVKPTYWAGEIYSELRPRHKAEAAKKGEL